LTPQEVVERQRLAGASAFCEHCRQSPRCGRFAMSPDKKVSGKSIRWWLLADIGKPVLRSDKPLPLAREVSKRRGRSLSGGRPATEEDQGALSAVVRGVVQAVGFRQFVIMHALGADRLRGQWQRRPKRGSRC
jgi:hypothetical protein